MVVENPNQYVDVYDEIEDLSQVEVIPPNEMLTQFKNINVAGESKSIILFSVQAGNLRATWWHCRAERTSNGSAWLTEQLLWYDTRSWLLGPFGRVTIHT